MSVYRRRRTGSYLLEICMDIFIFWEKPLFLSCGNVELLVVVCGQASGKYVMMEQVQRKINGYE